MNKNKKGNVHLYIPILVFVAIAGLLYFLFRSKQIDNTTENPPINTPVTTTPAINPGGSGSEPSTLDWTEYRSSDFVYQNTVYSGYSIKYPHTCSRTNNILKCNFIKGTGEIIINAGGHGAEPAETKVIKNNETKIIPAGEGKITLIEMVKTGKVVGTYWINKTDKLVQEPVFGFEFSDVPVGDLDQFEQIFDLMMTTFKFIENNSSPSKEVTANTKDGCVISGCSSEICGEEEMASTCELKPEAVCYKSATCEKQDNGKCGWTETSELSSCLDNY